jgi:hypothetical protein
VIGSTNIHSSVAKLENGGDPSHWAEADQMIGPVHVLHGGHRPRMRRAPVGAARIPNRQLGCVVHHSKNGLPTSDMGQRLKGSQRAELVPPVLASAPRPSALGHSRGLRGIKKTDLIERN